MATRGARSLARPEAYRVPSTCHRLLVRYDTKLQVYMQLDPTLRPHPERLRGRIRLESQNSISPPRWAETQTQRHRHRDTDTRHRHRRSDTHTRPPSCCSCRGLSRIASSCCFAALVLCNRAVLYAILYVYLGSLVACMHQQNQGPGPPAMDGTSSHHTCCCLRCCTGAMGIPYTHRHTHT